MIRQKLLKVNFLKGRKGYVPLFVCLHIGDGSQNSIYQTFRNPASKVSAHYSVDTNGEIWQFVDESDTAWANGIEYRPTAWIVKSNPGINKNLLSLSIEHAGWGNKDITEAQYQSTAKLVKDICQRWNIPLDYLHVIPHNSINASKSCPGKVSVARVIALASEKPPEVINDTPKQVEALRTRLTLLQRLLELYRKLSVLNKLGNNLKVGRLGSMNTTMNYSLTQAGNLSVFVGLIFIVLQKFGVNIARDEIEIFLTALFTVGGLIASWIGRYRKGDITLGGFRNPVTIGEKGDLD